MAKTSTSGDGTSIFSASAAKLTSFRAAKSELSTRFLSAPIRATAAMAGMRALVYTVNDPAEARRLDALGIDGIVTDAVDRFAPAAAVAD